jgi:hypothetical protein
MVALDLQFAMRHLLVRARLFAVDREQASFVFSKPH